MDRGKIFLVTADKNTSQALRRMLTKEGYQVTGEAADAPQALRLIRLRKPDLVIVDQELTGMNGLAVAEIIEQDRLAPVLLLGSYWQPGLLSKSPAAGIYGLLLKPVQEATLLAMVEGALINYRRICQLEKEVEKLKDALETRKAVERAKGILMETLGLTEAEAYRRIQKRAMDRCVPMRSIAEAIIVAYELEKGK
ncbi:MAG: two-component system, response regulator PdtaR [Clostridia bacterium]|nr:two-component system, response regulator PdtaR [Clostridia bacterium]